MIRTAMLLAAGEGRRMRPLTLTTPKPLLPVAGSSLIQLQLARLRDAGIERVVINLAYLGEQIAQALGDGRQLGLEIVYSREAQPLETGGGLNAALPLLGREPFLLVNGDVWSDIDLFGLAKVGLKSESLAHLVMVPNPNHNGAGDFSLAADGKLQLVTGEPDRVSLGSKNRIVSAPSFGIACTYSGVAILDPAAIQTYPKRRNLFPLREVLYWLIEQRRISGELHQGAWLDVGTPERLAELRELLEAR
ncbi:nucleotidyltransferase family protein [Teredinibacter waterburyi]|uniref:nucleotidyltransferase family protein n=1 Tax=Teredinibacter waterburyi TaxID=1500538 RepID=UPI002481C019|nr:nucleotidyltransferase family protein [Teredinibacter waterburyi]